MRGHERAHLRLRQAPGVGHARNLQSGVGRADVRIEAATRAGHGVGRHRSIGGEPVLLPVGRGQVLHAVEIPRVVAAVEELLVDPVDQLVAGPPEVRSPGRGRVIAPSGG